MTETIAKTSAVLDACVLYPPSLRDMLLWLAVAGTYAPRWTEKIHSEWIRNVLAKNPAAKPEKLERTRRLMNQSVPDCVVSDYERHISLLSLPDPDDRHVLAAAIQSGTRLIVTFNLQDFPNSVLATHGVESVHPDVFFLGLYDEKPDFFLRGLAQHRASLRNPPKTTAEYIQTLRAVGLKRLALRLETHLSDF